MELYQLTAYRIHELLQKKEVSVTDIVKSFKGRIEATEEELGSFLLYMPEQAIKQGELLDGELAKGKELTPLSGIPIGIKDNISTKGVKTTSGSKMLADYIPPYNATVVDKLIGVDSIMLGKLNMDELAMGSTGEYSAYGPTKNPWDLERIPGGSSSGAAAAVAAGQLPLSLGTDTGGSIRQPAGMCGIVGLKPTYGLVSRYGLIPTAASMDQIGPLARDVRDCALLLQAIVGHDAKDSTSLIQAIPDYQKSLLADVKGLRVGVPKEYFGDGVDPKTVDLLNQALKKLEEQGAIVEEMSMPHTECALPAYYIIAPTEISSSLARLDGTRYGYRNLEAEDVETMFIRSRSEGLGREVKFRTILGHYVSGPGRFQDYYVQGLKLRTLVKKDFDEAFKKYDVLLTPVSATTAWPRGAKNKSAAEIYASDICTIPANLAGVPALSMPCGLSDGLPVGLQLIGRHLGEETLLQTAYALEKSLGFPKELPMMGVK